MYSTSSQAKNWIFDSADDVEASRTDANQRFVEENLDEDEEEEEEEERRGRFLSVKEERQLVQHYEYVLKDFCGKFNPSMPKYVVGTTMAYMKRFYVENSVMDYHPRDVMLTALYLACKVEEFNVSIAQFVGNLKGDRNKAADLVLSYELMLMEKLHFHLTIHTPYRPLEGFIIDLRTRCPRLERTNPPPPNLTPLQLAEFQQQHPPLSPESLRRAADVFVDKSLNTDATLLFAPAHVALAALAHAATEMQLNLDPYFVLLTENSEEKLWLLKTSVSKVRSLVKKVPAVSRDQIKKIEEKLERCRNQAKNPASEEWKRKMQEAEDEEIQKTFKRRKTLEPKRDSNDSFKPLPKS